MDKKCKFCKNDFNSRKERKFCSYLCFKLFKQMERKVCNLNFFDIIDTEQKAYWLGFLYADGCIHKRKDGYKQLKLSLATKDKKHLLKFSNIFNVKIKDSIRKNNRINKKYYVSTVEIGYQKICDSLLKSGLNYRKTYEKNNILFDNIPEKLLKHFIRGFFDGDGGVSINFKKIPFTACIHMTGNKNFLTKIRDCVINKTKLSKVKIFRRKSGTYSLEWSGCQQIDIFKNFIYDESSIFLERKRKRFDLMNCIKRNKYDIKYRGVRKTKSGKFQANFFNKNKRIYLGLFQNEIDAALAYNEAIIKYNKPLYKLNNIRMETNGQTNS